MRYSLLIPFGLLALAGCVPQPTATTYVTPATTTTSYTPETRTTVVNAPSGYQPAYDGQPAYGQPTTTVIRTP